MSKKCVFFFSLAALLLGLVGCKGKNESNGDSFLKEGKYRNAVNSYTNALKKGKVSKDFYDSFVMAYTLSAKQTSKRNPGDDIIRSYIEQVHKYLPQAKKAATLDSVVAGLAEIGVAQVKSGIEYQVTLQGFRHLDSALSIAKRNNLDIRAAHAARQEAEKSIVTQAIENADGVNSDIAAEYYLLEAEVVAPNNEDLKKALDKIRFKNRNTWLIFAAADITPSPLVDKYGYVMYFPSINLTPTGATGDIQVWNSTGNNMPFEPNKLKIVSKTGEAVTGKYTGGGYCDIDLVDQKTGMFKPTKQLFKGSVGELRSEKNCYAKIAFTYARGFDPDYVEYTDSLSNIGRKYFGKR
ncbi:MAG: hypothetical protein FWC15_00195 [Fibromonadales bacterium]|nr:hypothetical protein [Fibromonadales bacterium]